MDPNGDASTVSDSDLTSGSGTGETDNNKDSEADASHPVEYRQDPDISRRNDAVAIFPEEVWRAIFGKLNDPQDLWRCYNTCELFADVLSQWRAGWILEIALPHMYRHLSKSKLLKCRLVCTGWNKKINCFLEDHPSIRPHDNKRDPRKLEFVNPVLEKGLNERNVYNFWNPDCNPHLQLTFTGNPFLGRYVTLMMHRAHGNEEPVETVDRFYEKIYTFLQLYGKEIFYLNLCDGGAVDVKSNFRSIHRSMWDMDMDNVMPEKLKFRQLVTSDVFHLVPNLRKLGFGGMEYEVQENLNIHPELLPLPPNLDSLEAYEIYGSANWNKPDPIAHTLMLRFRPQLKKLHARSTEWMNELYSLEWPLLTELYIRVNERRTWRVENVGVEMPSLRKLGLDVQCEWGFGFETLMKGFDELSSVTRLDTLRLAGLDKKKLRNLLPTPDISSWSAPSTLETLELEFDNSLCVGPRTYHVIVLLRRFPNIKNLHIFSRTRSLKYQSEVHLSKKCRWMGWDLSDLAALARANANDSNDTRTEIDEVHKFLGYEAGGGERGDMYRSNIWELLPQLNVFTFQWDVYTRDGYEEYSRKKNLGCDVKSDICN